MRAVAETATLGECGNVREARLDAADVVEQPELAQARRVDQHAAAGQLDELACRRRVPPAIIVAQPFDGLHLSPQQPIRQRRLADARRADEADGLAGTNVR